MTMDVLAILLQLIQNQCASSGFVGLLLLIIVALVYDRRRLIADLRSAHLRINDIVDAMLEANEASVDALQSLKSVLQEIRARLRI